MGHRPFSVKPAVKNKVPSSVNRIIPSTKNSSNIVKEEKMNGLRKITQEEFEAAANARRELLDQVSAKMGELLLRGYTMLDAYCNVCTGILMEDRQGVRVCVTCDLTNAQRNPSTSSPGGSRLVAEIPLEESDHLYEIHTSRVSETAPENIPQQSAGSSEALPSIEESLASLRQTKEKTLKELYKSGLERSERKNAQVVGGSEMEAPIRVIQSKSKTGSVKKSIQSSSTVTLQSNMETAFSIVDEKLRWYAERLAKSEDLSEIVQLQEAIFGALRILKLKH